MQNLSLHEASQLFNTNLASLLNLYKGGKIDICLNTDILDFTEKQNWSFSATTLGKTPKKLIESRKVLAALSEHKKTLLTEFAEIQTIQLDKASTIAVEGYCIPFGYWKIDNKLGEWAKEVILTPYDPHKGVNINIQSNPYYLPANDEWWLSNAVIVKPCVFKLINFSDSTLTKDDLEEYWKEENNLALEKPLHDKAVTESFCTNEQVNLLKNIEALLDGSHPLAPKKLQAALTAWLAIQEHPPSNGVKKHLSAYLTNNFGLEGRALDECSTVANWNVEGNGKKRS